MLLCLTASSDLMTMWVIPVRMHSVSLDLVQYALAMYVCMYVCIFFLILLHAPLQSVILHACVHLSIMLTASVPLFHHI